MRVRRLFTEKIFNLFDHDIAMNMDDRITIIHAPNGFGKTAVLLMTDGLFNSRYSALREVPFQRFGIEFDSGRTLLVTKDNQNGSRKRVTDHTLIFQYNGEKFEQRRIVNAKRRAGLCRSRSPSCPCAASRRSRPSSRPRTPRARH